MTAPSQRHAVVIDDEPSYLSLLEAVLGELLTCPIKTYGSAQEALEEIPSIPVGIIVTDFYMPRMDGVQFLKNIQPLLPKVPCIIVTGHKDLLDHMDLSDLHSLKVILAKPFKIEELTNAISRLWPEAMA
jgi:DNA-binding NtrC family response regulator